MANQIKDWEQKIIAEGDKVLAEVGEGLHIKKKKPFFMRGWFWLLSVFFIVLIVLGFGYVQYWLPLKTIISKSTQAQDYFLAAQDKLLQGEFKDAIIALEQARLSLAETERGINSLGFIARLGLLEKQRQTLKTIAVAGQNLSRGLELATNLTSQVMAPLTGPEHKKFNDLKPADKRAILKSFYEAAPEIQGAKAEIELAQTQMDQIDPDGLHPLLAQYVKDLKIKLTDIKSILERAAVLSRTVPNLLGYPVERVYLFLLQNNNELRPSGGFIGTVGVLKVLDGEIKSFETRNVYELDINAEKKLTLAAPLPITKYMQVKNWYLRDANWSPDFPTAVGDVKKLFQAESVLDGSPFKPEKFDGVIAITPDVVRDFLKLSGAIEIKNFVFNSDNFTERLQYLVEVGYEEVGDEYGQRKNIIGLLSQELIRRFQMMKLSQWVDLLDILQKNLTEKQIVLNLTDTVLQDEIAQEGWIGAVQQTPVDYLMFVDANLAAFKTDEYMKRNINYQVLQNEKGDLIAQATMQYANTGTFTWKSTRYRTYTRLYVPAGSKLISYTGTMADDRTTKKGDVDVGDELGKTYFGAFIAIEPGKTGALSFTYQLPDYIKKIVLDGHYSLLVQKQIGTRGHGLNLDLRFPAKIFSAVPAEVKTEWNDNFYRLSSDLKTDRQITLSFEK